MTFTIPQIKKQNSFNALRLLCSIIVICMHIFSRSGVYSEYGKYFDGHACVCVFFILSGFWVTRSFLTSDNLKTYFKKRAKRILPLYYISVGGGRLYSRLQANFR